MLKICFDYDLNHNTNIIEYLGDIYTVNFLIINFFNNLNVKLPGYFLDTI
ncbi:hypothetical protein GCM10009409_13580 [Shewanella saliphila]|uniref:Uncharacterized protein n=1 Tax=Shewanella saliphila TaxID=2282698 RepID=A0ABQ2Q5R8_9GAMM|nr:hypothetical protein GCM10009409_13580 [Shewanella saliphila]